MKEREIRIEKKVEQAKKRIDTLAELQKGERPVVYDVYLNGYHVHKERRD